MNFFGAVYAFFRLRLFAITIWVHFVVYFVLFGQRIHTRPGGAKPKMIYLRGEMIFLSLALHKKSQSAPAFGNCVASRGAAATFDPQLCQLASKTQKTENSIGRSAFCWCWRKTIFTHSQPQIKLGFICAQGKVMQIFGFPRKCIHLSRSIIVATLSWAWEIKKITHAEIETHTLTPVPRNSPLPLG